MNTKRDLTPGNVVRLLAYVTVDTTLLDPSSSTNYYGLFKDGHALVVQCPKTVWNSDFFGSGRQISEERAREEYQQHSSELEVIQTLLNTIDFKQSHWAYLIRTPDSQYRLVPRKPKTIHQIDAPLGWVPKVPESEIEIIRWISECWFEGFWNGKKTDVRVGWCNRDLHVLEEELKSLHICRNLEVAHEVYGYVVRDGCIIGFMSEPFRGRLVEFHDRALVYETFANLQANNVIYDWKHEPSLGEILIHEGKVRLTTLQQHMKIITDEERREIEATGELFNESHLRYIFDQLRLGPNPEPYYDRDAIMPGDLKVLTHIPYPGYSIITAEKLFEWFWNKWSLAQFKCAEDDRRESEKRRSKRKNLPILSDSSLPLDASIPSGALVRRARPKTRNRRSDISALLAPESIPFLVEEFEKSVSVLKGKSHKAEKVVKIVE